MSVVAIAGADRLEVQLDVAITGASGLIGTALAARLRTEGHRPISVVRRPVRAGEDAVEWAPSAGRIDAASLEGIDAVVHLAGAGIGDKRWSADYKAEVLDSRVGPTRLLATTLASLDRPPSVLVSGSAIGYYGDRGSERLTEDSPPGDLFLSRVCKEWEAAAAPAADAGIRVAVARTGVVLARDGGALPKLLPLFRLGLGGRLGSGKQWWSWISIDDETAALQWLLDHDVAGPVNLAAPGSTTNAEFTKALGRVLHRPTLLPVPAFGPRLLRGRQLADELLFASQRVVPAALTAAGFRFAHPDLDDALAAALDRSNET
jgi:uncharacterized protein (TIGR01777 family)